MNLRALSGRFVRANAEVKNAKVTRTREALLGKKDKVTSTSGEAHSEVEYDVR